MRDDCKYRAFISYSHKDKQFAKWLHKKIENYKIPKSLREKYPNLPKDLKRSVFRDEEELPISSALTNNILYALDNSELLIVVCSPSATSSKWVNKEIAYFKHNNGENSVLAIIKDGEPNATDDNNPDNEAFPKPLRYIIAEDETPTNERCEPLAGDARGYWNKEMAFVKMIASILKVDFADLWEREKREKKKQILKLGVIATIFIALFIYASTQLFSDSVNRELERVNNEIASIHYSIRHDNLPVETVIALNKELKELEKSKEAKEETQKSLGNLKTSLGQKAKEVYNEKGAQAAIAVLTSREALSRKEQLKKELSLEEISLAKLYVETNDYIKAQLSYEKALAIFFDFENVNTYSNFLEKQKHYDKAIELSHKLLKEKLSKDQSATLLNMLGLLYNKTNRYSEAEKLFLESLQISRTLAKANPSAYNAVLTRSLNNLAMQYKAANRYSEAEKLFLESLQISRTLAKANPSAYNAVLARSLNNLATLYNDTNRYSEAEQFYLEALQIWTSLAKANPSAYNADLAILLNNLATLYNDTNRYSEAEQFYLESLQIRRSLAQKTPNQYKQTLSLTLHNVQKLYQDTNQLDKLQKINDEISTLGKISDSK